MGVFDQAARYAAKLDSTGLFAWLVPRFTSTHRFQRFIDTALLAFPGEPDRICDTVAEFTPANETGRHWLLDVEFQSEPDADILERLAEYAYRLRREVRHGPGPGGKYAVASVLVNLTGPVQPAELRSIEAALDGAGLIHPVVLWTLREASAAEALAAIVAGTLGQCVLPWVSLMRGADEASTIQEWRRLAEAEPDNRRRADYGGLAQVFAELADRSALWRSGLEGYNVRQSQQVLEWQAQAREEGRAEGMRTALESQQVLEWQAQAREEGRTEGRAEGLRTALVRSLEARFGRPMPSDIVAAITSANLEQLDRWQIAAVTVVTLDDFRALVISGNGPEPAGANGHSG